MRYVCRSLLLAGLVALLTPLPTARASDATLPTARANDATLPGAEAFPPALRATLAEALSAKGSRYVPRTRHRGPDGAPHYSNRLLLESSPYLLQHAHNPVNWFPWGDEAFETARRLDRPVLVSIGYSTCHWCHVMEEESFDDVATARLLNEHFIAIKVDREVRPDVDAIYMAAARALSGGGGWPLNVFVTPERKPFFAGTYFPPTDARGRPAFRTVLARVRDEFGANRMALDRNASRVAAHLAAELEQSVANRTALPTERILDRAMAQLEVGFDDTWGGVGQRTKFPASLPLRFLLRRHRRSDDDRALEMAVLTLDRMARGGIHDQVGGGFHRYATERRWLIPHFEKMLYDNARLAVAYLEGWQVTERADFAAIVRRTLDYLLREMQAPEGAFHSATDADSSNPAGESEEGWFFTWTPNEIDAVLGPEAGAMLRRYHGVTASGNFEGRNILHVPRPAREVAAALGIAEPELLDRLAAAHAKLYAARALRPAPHRDEKILAAWNGLAISAFARAGFAFEEPRYVAAARSAARFVLGSMRSQGRLQRSFAAGRAAGDAFLDDYAFLIAGLLDLYEADPDPTWLREAIALQEVLDTHHADATGGGYFTVADDGEALLAREKPAYDGAEPAGNSVALSNLLRLAEFTGRERYRQDAVMAFSAFHERLERSPTALGEMLLAVDFLLDTPKEILVVRGAIEPPGMLAPLRSTFCPNRIIVVLADDAVPEHLPLIPLLRDKRPIAGGTTAYVCQHGVCALPARDPDRFREQLERVGALEPAP